MKTIFKTNGLSALTLIAGLCAGSAQATTFFDTSFESCAVGTGNDFPCEGWDDFGQERVTHLRVGTERAFSGSKSVHITANTIPGGSVNPDYRPSIYKSFPATNHLFLRVAIYQKAGFVLPSTGATKMIRFRPGQTANDPKPNDSLGSYPIFWLYDYFNSWAINIEQPCDLLPGGYWITGTAPRPDQWDQIEVEIKINTDGLANGLLRIWVNNILVKESLNRRWVSATPNGSCAPGTYWHPSDWTSGTIQLYNQAGNGERWFDNIAVGDTRIGPVNGSPPPPDIQAPTVPGNLLASAASSSQINLSWNASTDNVGVTGYKIFRGGSLISTATGTAFSNTGLNASTDYNYTVAAYDASNNTSGKSAAASTTTPAAATGADVVPPAKPRNMRAQ